MNRLTRDGTAEPVSRDPILRHARGQGNVHFPCSADHEQDWQSCPVDPHSAICDDHTYIVYIHTGSITVGKFLLDIILLRSINIDPTLLLYHRGTRLNAMKRFCLHNL